jgi:hypothetical protein
MAIEKQDNPIIATIHPKAAGARVALIDGKNGLNLAVLWFHDLGYAGRIAEAINVATNEQFNKHTSSMLNV